MNDRSQLEDPVWLAEAIQNLQSEIDAHLAEMARMKETLSVLREAQRWLVKVAEALPASPGSSVADLPQIDSRSLEQRRKQPKEGTMSARILDGVRLALKGAGRPLNRTELLRSLLEQGVVVAANDPARAVGKVLWRSKEFVHLKDGYWFGERLEGDDDRS